MTAGIVQEIDPTRDNKYQWQRYSRVRIDIKVSKPLIPGFFLPREGLKDLWIGLKY